jgi:hypothetical protein
MKSKSMEENILNFNRVIKESASKNENEEDSDKSSSQFKQITEIDES